MWRGKRCKVRGVQSLEQSLVVKDANYISRNEATQRVADDTQFGDLMAIGFQFFQMSFDFVCCPFGTNINSIVGEVSSTAIADECGDPLLSVMLLQSF